MYQKDKENESDELFDLTQMRYATGNSVRPSVGISYIHEWTLVHTDRDGGRGMRYWFGC